MVVLSLFDGISCGQVALERLGIKVDKYYASEIDKNAIKITQKNYPKTIQLGDVTELDKKTLLSLGKIDLLIGGSPCTDLSKTKQDRERKGLQGKHSSLYYEYIRILNIVKPTYFLLENVEMQQEWQDIITIDLGIGPIMLNSNVLTAQDRKRLYWTNIPFLNNIEDKNLVLKDIVLDAKDVDKKYWYDKPYKYCGDNEKIQCILDIKTHNLCKKVYNLNNKCGTLTCVGGGYQEKKVYQNGKCRKLTPLEYERLQTLPDNYTEVVSDSARYSACGNGWTVDIIVELFRGLVEI